MKRNRRIRLPISEVRQAGQAIEAIERAQPGKLGSLQPRFRPGRPAGWAFLQAIKAWLKEADLEAPPYSVDSRKRDTWLQTFWQREPHWAGVLRSVSMIDACRGWSLTGGRNQVSHFTGVLHGSYGSAVDTSGWREHAYDSALAFRTTDLGNVTEVEAAGEWGPLQRLYYMDSARSYLTGDPAQPLNYYPVEGGEQNWKPWQFFRNTSSPNTGEAFRGLGICATSAALEIIGLMYARMIHDEEQMGARAPRGLLLLRGIDQAAFETAMQARDVTLDGKNWRYYGAVAVLCSDLGQEIDAKLMALSQLPAGFKLETFVSLSMYAYALLVGYDPREFWPVSQGSLGTGNESEIQHHAARTKGGSEFMLSHQEQIQKRLPQSLLFEYEVRDLEGERIAAEVQTAKANLVKTLYESGLQQGAPLLGATTEEARQRALQLLAEVQVIPDEWTEFEENVTATDTEEARLTPRQLRERLLSMPHIQRAIAEYPDEPIVRYRWADGRETMRVLWRSGSEALRPAVWPGAQLQGGKGLGAGSSHSPKADYQQVRAQLRQVDGTPFSDYLDDYEAALAELAAQALDGELDEDEAASRLHGLALSAAILALLLGMFGSRKVMDSDFQAVFDAALAVLSSGGTDLEALAVLEASGLGEKAVFPEPLVNALQETMGAVDSSTLAGDLANEVYQDNPEALDSRLLLWGVTAFGFFSLGLLYDPSNPRLMFNLGPTKEHCIDCATADGKVKTAEEWRDSGIYPQSSALACGGWQCLCFFTRA